MALVLPLDPDVLPGPRLESFRPDGDVVESGPLESEQRGPVLVRRPRITTSDHPLPAVTVTVAAETDEPSEDASVTQIPGTAWR